ncbi:integrase core domain-containing protein, partial [Serratia bockelmannii]
HVHDSLHTRHVACAFKMALAGRRTALPLVHHSDREYLLGKTEDIAQARKMVRESVALYNTRRPHLSRKYKTPDEVHRALSG